jgi:hypothetical protein
MWGDAMSMISVVAQRYNTNLQRPPQLLIKPKQKRIKTLRNYFKFKETRPLNYKKNTRRQ